MRRLLRAGTGLRAVALAAWPAATAAAWADYDEECGVHYEQGQMLTNWSSTHHASPARMYEPKSAQEVVRVLQLHHASRQRVRPVGTALSPNGIGLSTSSADNMLSMAGLDYVEVDADRKQVTVGAGARVSSVLSELNKHGLTLENFSSIQEQQVGGWTQVSAHGTGISLPPVDEMVVRLQLATPTEGLMTLSRTGDADGGHLFRLAKVGLGSLGVVTELTLACIPKLNLRETTFVTDRQAVQAGHAQRLRSHRHVRYMWLPYTDTVVAVVSNPTSAPASAFAPSPSPSPSPFPSPSLAPATATGKGQGQGPAVATTAMRQLLHRLRPQPGGEAALEPLSFSQLRDRLLDVAPLDTEHIKAVNAAEAQYWAATCGSRVDDSTNILGFDCGGEQLVLEVCIPCSVGSGAGAGAGADPLASGRDLQFVRRILEAAEKAGIPAPSPIEQRWTARSTAPLSPAYSPDPAQVFCWVGVIMYLPPGQSDEARAAIQRRFEAYCDAIDPVCAEFGAKTHWAKIEPRFGDAKALRAQQDRVHAVSASAPASASASGSGSEDWLGEFNAMRAALDPHRVLGNKVVDALLDHPDRPARRVDWRDFKR